MQDIALEQNQQLRVHNVQAIERELPSQRACEQDHPLQHMYHTTHGQTILHRVQSTDVKRIPVHSIHQIEAI